MIYLLLIIFCVLMGLLSSRYKLVNVTGKEIKIYKNLSLLAIVFIAGFRGYGVGTDTSGTYWDIFNIAKNNLSAIRDRGYGFINYIISKYNGSYSLVLIVVSLLIYGFVFSRIYKSSAIPWYSVFLFFSTDFFFISLNMIRQSIVVAIFIYALPMVHSDRKKEIVKYWILALLGISMHTSGILLIALFFLYRYIKLTPKKAVIITICNVILYKVMTIVIIKLLFKISYIRKYFFWYFQSSYNNGQISLFGILIPFSVLVFWAFIYSKNVKAREDSSVNDLGLSMLMASNLMIYSGSIPLIQRIAFYFTSQIIILLPTLFLYINLKKTRNIVKTGVFICYLIYMIITIFIQKQEGVLPYSNVLFGG